MSEPEDIQVAEIKHIRRISKVWFIPIVALLIAMWMVFYSWNSQGQLITITFDNAEGLEINTTKLKLRDITIGKVVDLQLTEKYDGIKVTIRLDKNTDSLLRTDTNFWVVKPIIGKGGISGINTIFSGNYIRISPGIKPGKKTEFVGLETPPITPIGTPGLHVTLNSNDEFAFSAGDPVIYKGLTVGKIEDVHFNFEEKVVYYNAFVNAPYHELITQNTRFWNISGVKVDLKADGISVQIGNIDSLLTNGVTFGVPEGMPAGAKITERDFFTIYPDYAQATEQRFKQSLEYVMLVSNSIRGLSAGAPVEYRGVKIGEVIETNIHVIDHTMILQEDMKIPVLVKLQPGRVGLPDDKIGLKSMQAQIEHWVKNGLRATLSTGSLLTGSLFVELQHHSALEPIDFEKYDKYAVIPTIEDDFSQITRKASAFMDSLNKMPLEQISTNANQLISELTSTVKAFQSTGQNISELLDNINQQDLPLKINQALASFATMASSYSEGSATSDELNNSLRVLQDTLHDLKPVLKQLNGQPNSLIFSGAKEEIIEPKSKTRN